MPAPAATIPMPGDLADLIGPAAEHVENRSLLLDKFVFHKRWPVVEETTRRGHDFVKWDEASRWSFMRIADGANMLLRKEAAEKRRKAGGRNVEPQNRDRLNAEAEIATTLANTRWDTRDLAELRAKHTRRFIDLFRGAYGDRCAVTVGQLEGRLAINLADSLIQNAGICLDRLFGLPYIPGSAIKGVCRHTALEELRAATDVDRPELLRLFCTIFGTAENDFDKGDLKAFRAIAPHTGRDQKGAVAFLPAYPVNEAKVVVDLTNVHFPDYYRTGRTEDQSKENPRPNPFPAVEIGTQFAYFLVLNVIHDDPTLLAVATRWLEKAITERGLGAKTAAGYGWFSIQNQVLDAIDAAAKKDAEAAAKAAEAKRQAEAAEQEEKARIASLSPEQAIIEGLLKLNDEQFATFAKNLADKEKIQQRAFITLLTQNKDKRERWKTWKKKKPDLAKIIQDTAASLNLTLP
jgi:CRISPR type III-B/RAMP module RAMP protein Cmr6